MMIRHGVWQETQKTLERKAPMHKGGAKFANHVRDVSSRVINYFLLDGGNTDRIEHSLKESTINHVGAVQIGGRNPKVGDNRQKHVQVMKDLLVHKKKSRSNKNKLFERERKNKNRNAPRKQSPRMKKST